ncbi:MAG TPA: hypothetical protein VNG12_20735 [Acidimicrobiales bacterium]|nr:hypothetical protein [Acidimicrobiales bacterium]
MNGDTVAVDWSGAKTGAASRLWLAHVRDGRLVALRNGRSRVHVVHDLVALRREGPGGLVVGLDFAFSFPAWFLRQRGYRGVGELWEAAGVEGEQWLAECEPPFWGRPGRRRPPLEEHYRRCEKTATVGAIRAKSVFQIGGAGAVGTGSVRGMPFLTLLRDAGFSIWPFDPVSPWVVLEIYPRLLTGPVNKSDPAERARYMHGSPLEVEPEFEPSIIGSEDAFDAAISALVLHRQTAALTELSPSTDPLTRLEGAIWPPPNIRT